MPFDVAAAYYDHRERIAADAARLRLLIREVDAPTVLTPSQWAQWYAVALAFEPDLILDLGRGRGNSTAMLCEAAHRLGSARLISLCYSSDWETRTVPRIRPHVEPGWFDRVDARLVDITRADFESIVGTARRVLVAWDVHGIDVAETVFGVLLPVLYRRSHLVLIHDISDNRYTSTASYGGGPLWKGAVASRRAVRDNRVNIGWMSSVEDSIVALADFTSRNGLEVGSADHAYATYFAAHPERAREMRVRLGDDLFSSLANWVFLSLDPADARTSFPAPPALAAPPHRCGVAIDGGPPMHRSFDSAPIPWAYAARYTWRPAADAPTDRRVWLQVTMKVDRAPIGVGLLSRDGRTFEYTTVVAPGAPAVVRVPIDGAAEAGPLVLHTWDRAISARATVDEIALVW